MPETQSPQEKASEPQSEPEHKDEHMCCDGKRTAAEHRKESPDGKCCVD